MSDSKTEILRRDRPATAGPRVLLFAEWFYPTEGGSQRVVHNFAVALSRAGWQPVVYTRAMPGDKAFDAKQPYRVFRSRRWGKLWKMVEAGGNRSRIARLLLVAVNANEIRRLRSDCILGLHLVPAYPPARLLGLVRKTPFCVYAHGEELEMGATSRAMKLQTRASLRAARIVFVNSRETGRVVKLFGVDPSRVVIQFPTPDEYFFDPLHDNREGLRDDWNPAREDGSRPLLLVTISRLAERKGMDTVLYALAKLRDQGGDPSRWLYFIGGTGDDKSRLRGIVEKLGLKDRVRFLGSLDEKDKRNLIEAADLFVMPNRRLPSGEQEGFGIVFVEAALRGTASIGGKSGGTADALKEGTSGWLVDPNTPDETAQVIASILENPAPLEAMREQARSWAYKRFRRHLEHRKAMQVMEELIHKVAQK